MGVIFKDGKSHIAHGSVYGVRSDEIGKLKVTSQGNDTEKWELVLILVVGSSLPFRGALWPRFWCAFSFLSLDTTVVAGEYYANPVSRTIRLKESCHCLAGGRVGQPLGDPNTAASTVHR